MDPRIAEYRSQLDQVEALVAADPSNEQLKQIKQDLHSAIQLTEKLIEQEKKENEDDEYDIDAYYDAAHSETASPHAVGDRVEVISGERPFAAVITAVGPKEATLRYYEFPDTEVTLPLSSLRPLTGAVYKEDALLAGMKCEAKYATDQKWYEATISALTDSGYRITYDKYGNSEEVPLEYLRPKLSNDNKRKQSSNSASSGGVQLIAIPESLKILPTDSEAERERKKKRIKAIKSKNRLATKEAEVSAVQNTWKSFVNKGTKKSLAGVVKQSMFAAPDKVEGRVGVIGSGQGMTSYDSRKKHKYQV